MRRPMYALATVFAILLFVGCGGDESAETGSGGGREANPTTEATAPSRSDAKERASGAGESKPATGKAREPAPQRPESSTGRSGPATRDGDTTEPAETNREPAWSTVVRQGDEICKDANEERQNLLREYTKAHPPGKNGLARSYREDLVLKVALPPYETEVQELPKLEASGKARQKLDEVVAGLEVAIGKSKSEPLSLLDGSGTQFDQVEALAKRLGFKVCGRA